jgi:ribonuclease P protein component
MVQGSLIRVSALKSDSNARPTRIGVVTSKKVGGAVVRNRVRRRLREIFRLARPDLSPGWMIITSAKTAAADASFEELREEWLLLVRRLSILRVSA